MTSQFSARLRFVALTLLLFVSIAAKAQFRASIQGTVTDPDGAVVPNAQLTLKDNGTNKVLTATSDAAGTFNFNALPSDQFTLTTTAPGFKQNVIQNLQIIPEQANSVAVKLELGQQTTSVTVNGDTAAAVDTETAAPSAATTFSICHPSTAMSSPSPSSPPEPSLTEPSPQAAAFAPILATRAPAAAAAADSSPPKTVSRPTPTAASMRPTASPSTASAPSAPSGVEPPSSHPTRTPSTTSASSPTTTTPRTVVSAARRP
jgi:hypothetical protein